MFGGTGHSTREGELKETVERLRRLAQAHEQEFEENDKLTALLETKLTVRVGPLSARDRGSRKSSQRRGSRGAGWGSQQERAAKAAAEGEVRQVRADLEASAAKLAQAATQNKQTVELYVAALGSRTGAHGLIPATLFWYFSSAWSSCV